MLHRVFKRAIAAVLTVICFATTAQTQVTGMLGVDAWHTPETAVRYTPNYATPKPWQSTEPWARLTVQHQQDTDIGPLTFTVQGQASAVSGHRIDRLDADWRLTPNAGIRLGVLPYRTSWCRTYTSTSPWISEPDAFCRFAGLHELAEGSFGAQAYVTTTAGPWIVDTMAGVYRPLVDGQSSKLGPYVPVGPDVSHAKAGASLNALHMATGLQLRAAWLRTHQVQDSSAGSYQRRLDYDTHYLAAEGHITPKLEVRATLAAYLGDQTNPALPFAWDGRSTTVEAAYKPTPGHTLALGLSRYRNATTYAKAPHHQNLSVPSVSLAWRVELPHSCWLLAQATRTQDVSTTRQGVTTDRAGNALGLRLGKAF